MDTEQIATELRELSDRLARVETNVDQLYSGQNVISEREIPASTADVRHRLVGVLELAADVAATAKKLALEVASHTDRLDLLERQADGAFPEDITSS